MGEREVKRSCCTWPKVLAVLLFSIITGVVIWQFAPVEKALDEIIPQFNHSTGDDSASGSGGANNTAGDGAGNDDNGDGAGSDGNADNGGVDDEPVDTYQFMQCSQQAINAGNCCNGLDTICDLGVDDILYATTHNANAAFDSGFRVSPNHNRIFQDSLEAGYRGINLDVCNCDGQLQFCHGLCNVGSLDVEETLADIDQFLDANPTEVMLINIQLNEKPAVVDINAFDTILRNVNGGAFANKLYVHPTADAAWPTLRQAIAAETRVLMFHFNGPDCASEACPSGLHYWFQYAAETEFSFTNQAAIDTISYSCNITRGSGPQSETFFGVNNFVTPPNEDTSRVLNEYDFAKARIAACSGLNRDLDVNVIYADFWSEGDLPRVAQDHNRALAARRRQLRRSGLRKN